MSDISTTPTSITTSCPVTYNDYHPEWSLGSLGKKPRVIRKAVMNAGFTAYIKESAANIHDHFYNEAVKSCQRDLGIDSPHVDGCPGPGFIEAFFDKYGVDINALWEADDSSMIDLWMGPNDQYPQFRVPNVMQLHQPTSEDLLEDWFQRICCVSERVRQTALPMNNTAVFANPVRFKRNQGGDGGYWTDDETEVRIKKFSDLYRIENDPIWVIGDATGVAETECWKNYSNARFVHAGHNPHPFTVLQIANLICKSDPRSCHAFSVPGEAMSRLVWEMLPHRPGFKRPGNYDSKTVTIGTDGEEWYLNA